MSAGATMAPAPQHMRALEIANQVRLARADLKRRVAVGELRAADIVLSCPSEAETMPIMDLLLSQRRWGLSRCRKLLTLMQIAETKRIGKMTDRQRRTLAQLLDSTPGASAQPDSISSPPAPGAGYSGFTRG